MNTKPGAAVALAVTLLTPLSARSQTTADVMIEKIKAASAGNLFAGLEKEVLEIVPVAPRPGVRNAPFTADAVTEFTQTLGDGNRIERTFTTSMARDSAGRIRREQEVAMLGPFAALQRDQPKLVFVSDPGSGVAYTLDDRARIARRQDSTIQIRSKIRNLELAGKKTSPTLPGSGKGQTAGRSSIVSSLQPLGTRNIEGVAAEGTRTTVTIPAGTIGNVNSIDVVTERWFSTDLQADVLITRRDPRSGDTVYRLTNIVRAEPPSDLFEVPAGYTIVSDTLKKTSFDIEKLVNAARKK